MYIRIRIIQIYSYVNRSDSEKTTLVYVYLHNYSRYSYLIIRRIIVNQLGECF